MCWRSMVAVAVAVAVGLMLGGCGDGSVLGLSLPTGGEQTGSGSGAAASSEDDGDDSGGPVTTGADDSDASSGESGTELSAAELYAQARCTALAGCECPMMPFADPGECATAMEELLLAQQERFIDASTDFACFDAIVGFYEASACETTAQTDAPACELFAGDGGLDEPCVRASFTTLHADSCADGSTCVTTIDGLRCRPDGDTSHVIAAGEPCVGRAGIAAPCEAGHWCDSAGSQLCTPRVALGQPCSGHAACDSGYCDESSVCADKLPPGSPCTNTVQCASPCPDEGCERALCAEGECRQGVPQVCFTEDL